MASSNPNYHRHSIRLPGYDYSQPGAYYITICTHNRQCLFGEIVNNEMILNEYGEIVRYEWYYSVHIRNEIELFENEFIVMPNHIHGIVRIIDNVGATGWSPPTTTIGTTTRTIKKIIVIVCRRVQIICYQTNKSNSSNPWHSCLATQLLRTYHP